MKNSMLNDEFYKIVAKYEKEFSDAERKSSLPDNPDMDKIERFVEKINRRIVNEDIYFPGHLSSIFR